MPLRVEAPLGGAACDREHDDVESDVVVRLPKTVLFDAHDFTDALRVFGSVRTGAEAGEPETVVLPAPGDLFLLVAVRTD